MPRREYFTLFMVNLVKNHEYWWKAAIRREIDGNLTRWFKTVLTHSPDFKGAILNCTWKTNPRMMQDDELVVHFVANPRRSVIRNVEGTVSRTESGACKQTSKGMVSEVYVSEVAGDAKLGQLLSIVAFHELMHNQLDADPNQRAVPDIHKLGGAAAKKMSSSSLPTDDNMKKLGRHLGAVIPQYTGHFGGYRYSI